MERRSPARTRDLQPTRASLFSEVSQAGRGDVTGGADPRPDESDAPEDETEHPFRRTVRMDGHTAVDADKDASARPAGSGHLVDSVVALMSLGLDVPACSRRLGVPADLVDLAARHARAEGRLPAAPTILPCGPGSCRPDHSSLLCAGCPLAPPSGRSVLTAAAGGALRRLRTGLSRLMRNTRGA